MLPNNRPPNTTGTNTPPATTVSQTAATATTDTQTSISGLQIAQVPSSTSAQAQTIPSSTTTIAPQANTNEAVRQAVAQSLLQLGRDLPTQVATTLAPQPSSSTQVQIPQIRRNRQSLIAQVEARLRHAGISKVIFRIPLNLEHLEEADFQYFLKDILDRYNSGQSREKIGNAHGLQSYYITGLLLLNPNLANPRLRTNAEQQKHRQQMGMPIFTSPTKTLKKALEEAAIKKVLTPLPTPLPSAQRAPLKNIAPAPSTTRPSSTTQIIVPVLINNMVYLVPQDALSILNQPQTLPQTAVPFSQSSQASPPPSKKARMKSKRSENEDSQNSDTTPSSLDYLNFVPYSTAQIQIPAATNPLRLAVQESMIYPPSSGTSNTPCPARTLDSGTPQEIRQSCVLDNGNHVHISEYEIIVDSRQNPIETPAVSRIRTYEHAEDFDATAAQASLQVTTRHILQTNAPRHQSLPTRAINGQNIIERCMISPDDPSFHIHSFALNIDFPRTQNPIRHGATRFTQCISFAPSAAQAMPSTSSATPSAPSAPAASSSMVKPKPAAVTDTRVSSQASALNVSHPQLKVIADKQEIQNKIKVLGLTAAHFPQISFPSSWSYLHPSLQQLYIQDLEACHRAGMSLAHMGMRHGYNSSSISGPLFLGDINLVHYKKEPGKRRMTSCVPVTSELPDTLPLSQTLLNAIAHRQLLNGIIIAAQAAGEIITPLSANEELLQRLENALTRPSTSAATQTARAPTSSKDDSSDSDSEPKRKKPVFHQPK